MCVGCNTTESISLVEAWWWWWLYSLFILFTISKPRILYLSRNYAVLFHDTTITIATVCKFYHCQYSATNHTWKWYVWQKINFSDLRNTIAKRGYLRGFQSSYCASERCYRMLIFWEEPKAKTKKAQLSLNLCFSLLLAKLSLILFKSRQ